MQGRPRRLRNGQWGAQTSSSVKVGDVITVTTRDGKTWYALVEKIVWKNKKLKRALVQTGGPPWGV